MNIVQKTCLFFTIVGAVNWGLIGLFGFDLVASIFGYMTIATRVIYTLIKATLRCSFFISLFYNAFIFYFLKIFH